METYEEIRNKVEQAVNELFDIYSPQAGQIFVVGCSSSEIIGKRIGKGSCPDAAGAVLDGVLKVVKQKGMYLAAQCCEHLNRALVIEREAAEKFGYETALAVPKTHAGGSFATAAYLAFSDPVLVEHVKASAGLDIGSTFIGMHLKDVAVPCRLSFDHIGEAFLTSAYTRPKLIGGIRAQYE